MKKMLTPSDLRTKVVSMKFSGQYDWKKQCVKCENLCKAGTMYRTGNTGAIGGTVEDWNQD